MTKNSNALSRGFHVQPWHNSLSLFDFTESWPDPYAKAGYDVICFDIKREKNVYDLDERAIKGMGQIRGVMLAPPCTDFAGSGAQYWPDKDADGRTAASVSLVHHGLKIVDWAKPAWWALENPVGRLPKCVPELGQPFYFQPHWYGDPYTKKTGLWGNFNRDLPRNDVEPVKVCSQGSWLMKLGGKSEKTKELRSVTPSGFAKAFFQANP